MYLGTGTLTSALLVLMMVSCVQSHCDTIDPQEDCIALFKLFQQALVNPSSHNLFRLQVVFYPLSRSTPALVNVTYKLNITCDPKFGESNRSKHQYVFGWSDRRLYRIFHPAVINLLRFQLPFWILEVSEDALTDYLDVDALLWDGANQLPSVNISLDVKLSPEDFTNSCPPGGDIIQLALGEVNHWLKAYAKFAQREEKAIKFALADDKGFTLPHTAVKQYNRSELNDANSVFGRRILWYAYCIDLALAVFLAPILLWPMVIAFKKIYVDDSDGALHSEYYQFILSAASFVALEFIFATITIEFYQLEFYNEFVHMKLGSLLGILLIISFFIIIYVFINFEHCSHRLAAFFVVFSLSTFAAIMLLGFAPTILLLFIHPVNTSAMLALHIALFYTSTTIVAVFFHHAYKWIRNHTTLQTNDDSFPCKDFCCKITPSPPSKEHFIWFLFSMFFIMIIALLPISYICIILLYQFVIGGSDYDSVAFSDVAKYIPSLMIGVIGFRLNHGTFTLSQKKKKESEDKKKAGAIWTYLEETAAQWHPPLMPTIWTRLDTVLKYEERRQAEASWKGLEEQRITHYQQ